MSQSGHSRPGRRPHRNGDLVPGEAVNADRLSAEQDLDALGGQDIQYLFRVLGILATHQLPTRLDDCHSAAEAAIGLCHFDADIASAQHDQVRRQIVELQRLDVRECTGRFKTRNIRIAACVPTLTTTSLLVSKRVPPSFRATSTVFGPTKRPLPTMSSAPLLLYAPNGIRPRDRSCPACAAHLAHVGLDSSRQRAELRGVLDEMADPRAPEFVLGRQAGDGGARAADPAASHDRYLFAGTAQMPCEQLSALAAAEDYDIDVFGLRHDYTISTASSLLSALAPWRIAAFM